MKVEPWFVLMIIFFIVIGWLIGKWHVYRKE